MLINDKTLKIIDTILKNEIGLSCEELSFLDSTAQEEILVQRYNPTKKIRHFRLGEKVILDDGTYMMAGIPKIIERKELNAEFEKILKKTN